MSRKLYSWTLSLRRTSAPPRKLFWVLGCWVVVWVKADYFPGAGGVGSLRLRPLFVPSIAVPSRPPRLLWIKSIYRPLAPLSLSLSLPLSPPMMRRTHSFMAVLARPHDLGYLPSFNVYSPHLTQKSRKHMRGLFLRKQIQKNYLIPILRTSTRTP